MYPRTDIRILFCADTRLGFAEPAYEAAIRADPSHVRAPNASQQ
jgi:hypothetical protein